MCIPAPPCPQPGAESAVLSAPFAGRSGSKFRSILSAAEIANIHIDLEGNEPTFAPAILCAP